MASPNTPKAQEQLQRAAAAKAELQQRDASQRLKEAQAALARLGPKSTRGDARAVLSRYKLAPEMADQLLRGYVKSRAQSAGQDTFVIGEGARRGAPRLGAKQAYEANERSIRRTEKAAQRKDAERQFEEERRVGQKNRTEEAAEERREAESNPSHKRSVEPSDREREVARKIALAAQVIAEHRAGRAQQTDQNLERGRLGQLSQDDAQLLREAAYALDAAPKTPEHAAALLERYQETVRVGKIDPAQVQAEMEHGADAALRREIETEITSNTDGGIRRAAALLDYVPEEVREDLEKLFPSQMQEVAAVADGDQEIDLLAITNAADGAESEAAASADEIMHVDATSSEIAQDGASADATAESVADLDEGASTPHIDEPEVSDAEAAESSDAEMPTDTIAAEEQDLEGADVGTNEELDVSVATEDATASDELEAAEQGTAESQYLDLDVALTEVDATDVDLDASDAEAAEPTEELEASSQGAAEGEELEATDQGMEADSEDLDLDATSSEAGDLAASDAADIETAEASSEAESDFEIDDETIEEDSSVELGADAAEIDGAEAAAAEAPAADMGAESSTPSDGASAEV